MVKENHTQKTVIMATAIEDRLIEHVQVMNSGERVRSIPKRQQTTESDTICRALVEYLDKVEADEADEQ